LPAAQWHATCKPIKAHCQQGIPGDRLPVTDTLPNTNWAQNCHKDSTIKSRAICSTTALAGTQLHWTVSAANLYGSVTANFVDGKCRVDREIKETGCRLLTAHTCQ